MRISIDSIGPDGLDLDETLSVAWLRDTLGPDAPFAPTADGRLTVHLSRSDDMVHVRGRARVALQAACSRCLGPVPLELDTPVEVTLVPQEVGPALGSDGSLTDDDMSVVTYEGEEIDLSGIVHDEVFLELPMSPVCSDACAGLCSSCGKDLNEGPCECKPPVDVRWQALQRIKISN